ncbi:MAG: DUF4440 domain-containing protein [Pseudomonadota bacterium]|nr:DUF4440 domain-containing protein [Pseudomonadota bacterium]
MNGFAAIAAALAASCLLSSTLSAKTVDEEIEAIEKLAEAVQRAQPTPEQLELVEADIWFAHDAAERHVSDAFADRFLADGKMISGGRPVVTGPENVRAALAASAAEWYWAPVEATVSGDLGVTWGRAFIVARGQDGAADQTYRGRYVTVWRRDADRRWKIWLDTGTEAPPEE